MKPIETVDPNFRTVQVGSRNDVMFYDVLQEPFQIYGLLRPQEPEEGFLRMPAEMAAQVSEGVSYLNTNTAGGRVRFVTDSPYVAIHAELHNIGKMPHFALSGSAGFDLYYQAEGKERYGGTFMPPFDLQTSYEAILELPDEAAEREITVNFPLYSGVRRLQIGLKAGCRIRRTQGYAHGPAVFYGSSITQGGCASRPGNAYQSILSRMLGMDFWNLGFSGSAKGEEAMGAYLAGLPMAAFVYDYDHNAPSPEHLQRTHARMFLQIRERQPELPVIMLSRPKPELNEEEQARRAVIYATYEAARARGDRHVYWIDGSELLQRFGGDSGTVDGCHPNDLGFMCMAEGLREVLQSVLS
ncbi:MAG: hypothetical protein HFE64_08545 [Lachnospiraceae bacterium]|jgi:lysophospholipase L1-like esterase|nr:hypothetical protein [Lachnospiraceae bacterium]